MSATRTWGIAVFAATALAAAGCGGDDKPAEKPASISARTATPVPLSAPEQIKAVGDNWAPRFAAADKAACQYMTDSALEACEMVFVGGAPGRLQQQFDGATVEEVVVRGRKAGARFLGGATVVFAKVPDAPADALWRIFNLGGNAGKRFFR